MSTSAKPRATQVLLRLVLAALCALCLQTLCSCAGESGGEGEEGIVEHAIKYASTRTTFDLAESSVVNEVPDAEIEISLLSLEDLPDGTREIELEPAVVSDTMAAWSADEWAENRDDLFFNFVAQFNIICKQARNLDGIPEGYEVTSPDYMVVYDSQENAGFVVTSTGVYRKTQDPENPIGEVVVLSDKD